MVNEFLNVPGHVRLQPINNDTSIAVDEFTHK